MATSIFRKNFPQVDELQKKADEAKYIIGLDLHKLTTAITVVDKEKQEKPVFQRKRVKNNELIEVLQRFQGKKIVIAEAAYGWFPLRRALEGINDITFVLFDPRKTSSWIKTSGIKNDRIDAEVLAYACLKGGLPALTVFTPGETCRDRLKLVTMRDRLISKRTSVKNQIKAIDRDYGVNSYTGEIVELSNEVNSMLEILEKQLRQIESHIAKIDKIIKIISKKDPAVILLSSVPHIGPLTAFALRNKMENTGRFKNAKHLCSYFGLGIRQKQSGDGIWTGHLTRRGNTLVRKLLVQGAQGLKSNHPDYVETYFPRLGKPEETRTQKHSNKMAIAVARKNLTFAYHAWKKGEVFDMKVYRGFREEWIRKNKEKEEVKDETGCESEAVTKTETGIRSKNNSENDSIKKYSTKKRSIKYYSALKNPHFPNYKIRDNAGFPVANPV